MTKYQVEIEKAQDELNELANKLRERTGVYANEYTTLAYGRVMFEMNILGAYLEDAVDLEVVASTFDDGEAWLGGVSDYVRDNEPKDAENFPFELIDEALEIVTDIRDLIEEDVPRDPFMGFMRQIGAM